MPDVAASCQRRSPLATNLLRELGLRAFGDSESLRRLLGWKEHSGLGTGMMEGNEWCGNEVVVDVITEQCDELSMILGEDLARVEALAMAYFDTLREKVQLQERELTIRSLCLVGLAYKMEHVDPPPFSIICQQYGISPEDALECEVETIREVWPVLHTVTLHDVLFAFFGFIAQYEEKITVPLLLLMTCDAEEATNELYTELKRDFHAFPHIPGIHVMRSLADVTRYYRLALCYRERISQHSIPIVALACLTTGLAPCPFNIPPTTTAAASSYFTCLHMLQMLEQMYPTAPDDGSGLVEGDCVSCFMSSGQEDSPGYDSLDEY